MKKNETVLQEENGFLLREEVKEEIERDRKKWEREKEMGRKRGSERKVMCISERLVQ